MSGEWLFHSKLSVYWYLFGLETKQHKFVRRSLSYNCMPKNNYTCVNFSQIMNIHWYINVQYLLNSDYCIQKIYSHKSFNSFILWVSFHVLQEQNICFFLQNLSLLLFFVIPFYTTHFWYSIASWLIILFANARSFCIPCLLFTQLFVY